MKVGISSDDNFTGVFEQVNINTLKQEMNN